ncbi:MAG TPA: amino acid adenylation domain-containing protein [Candidatus Choladousia intestinigallinarum]|nr:amino acid adenylation domain-containing protein [Candidatus Choladousia intestinigallinarum]
MQRNVLEYLEQAVLNHPEKIIFGDVKEELSCQDFMALSKRTGTALSRELQGYRRRPVAVLCDRSIWPLIAFFGTVYSGNFYVPIDRQMPLGRVAAMLETLRPEAIVGQRQDERILEQLSGWGKRYFLEELLENSADEELLEGIRREALDTDPLYAIFTSGSTGVPKGVLVSHRSVIDLADQFQEEFGFTQECVFGNQAPFDFDVSVKDIYSTLKSGACMYVIPKTMFSFPAKLIDYMNEKKITSVIWAVSAMRILENLDVLSQKKPLYLKHIMFSGETMPIKVLNYWRKHLPDPIYVNLYGPTEITCNCTFFKVEGEFQEGELLPIGRPFKNTGILLLDGSRQVNEPGVLGEICVRGSCLALGYYNNREKTEEAFCQNPTNVSYPEKIYRTGDLGKYDGEGRLVFVSRKDHQIKHQGHRIELGEIEAAASSLACLEACVCLYDRGREVICLFYQARNPCDKEILRELGKKLPRYMLPGRLEYMRQLPLNKNGKIDRTELTKKV